ncbi:Outer membrane receptor protein involved in Fe transport [Tenacibaculum sp. 190524A02b]|uniref:Outer membrane receptor protein involved in Fe transport n=1 Tax=Tenacibaculum vairaonense TaxID=3137860 RepID=A0ABM9PH48_9FLAO
MQYPTTFLLFLFLGSFSLQAQHSITGKVTDENNLAIPYANIILNSISKTATPKGVISDENGNYSFNNIPQNNYQLEVYVLGFQLKKSAPFNLSEDKKLDFILKEESQTLNEVEITAKRPIIKQTAEKLIVDLQKSDMVNANLQDVVKRIPGVLVTNNGINFAGRTDVRILINGKTTHYMDVKSLLRDLPADAIAKVELIEQPGAEFDAEGSGPIINIILSKNTRLGTHGTINGWIGEDQGFEFGSSASIASYKNKLNWQANIGISNPTWREDLFIKRTIKDTTYDQTTIEPYAPKSSWAGGNLDYYINDSHSIGFGARFNHTKSDRISKSNTIISSLNRRENQISENSFDRARNTFNFNPYYEYKTDKNKLTVDFNYVRYTNNNIDNIYQTSGNTVQFANQRYLQDGEFTIRTFKIDYNQTLSNHLKISFGSKYAIVDTSSDLKYFIQNATNNAFDFQKDLSNIFKIDEKIVALYSKVNFNKGTWSFSGGLRFENSNTKGFSSNTQKSNDRKITKLFPSLSISKKLNEHLGLNFAYSYRIQRPSYNSLNSFVQYYDPLTSEVGNPNLKPSFTNNLQFNLTFDSQPFFTISYSTTKDALFQFISQDDTTAQVQRSIINLSDRENWNFRLFGPLNFIKKLDGFTGFIVNYNKFQSANLTPKLLLTKWNYGWYTQANYSLPWDINFEMSSYFGSGALEGQIDIGWIGNLDFSIGKKFLNKKLKVNLGFNKMLNRGYVGTVNYNNINAAIESNGSRQNIQLRVTYSFGSKFGKKKSKRNSSKEEENRINDNN